jgi:protocatechuate 3,4-dioxygenase beta subunit
LKAYLREKTMADPVPYARDDATAQPPHKFADFKASAVRAPSHPLVRAPHTLTEITGPSGDEIW